MESEHSLEVEVQTPDYRTKEFANIDDLCNWLEAFKPTVVQIQTTHQHTYILNWRN